ncbi:hypothetical protein QN239_33390 [Mycolicibacterium sp. Y3]
MNPQRQKRKPVFNPHAIDDDLDDLLQSGPPQPPRPQVVPSPVTPSTPTEVATTPHSDASRSHNQLPAPAPEISSAAPVEPASPPPSAAVAGPPPPPQRTPERSPLRSVPSSAIDARTRHRPPEVNLAAEVYDALYQLQIAEKKARKGLARPMGTIVLDAIEKHASTLQGTWAATEETVGEGGLFVRPSTSAVPRRRRHVVAPRTVVLSGVNAANGQRLDALVDAWGAGTRSALVEQALRYEFNLT